METSRRFVPLLTELGGWQMDFCYKHVAPQRRSRAFSAGFSTEPDGF